MKEQEEMEGQRKYAAQPHLYTLIKVAREKDLVEQIGKYLYFDLVDHENVRSFRIQKQMPFTLFKEEVAREFGVPVQCQRFWLCARRENHTYRPHRPLTPKEEAQPLRELTRNAYHAELKLFLEVELGPDHIPVSPPKKSKEDILLFFKLYNPEKEELRYVGRLFVNWDDIPTEILPKLNEMVCFNQDEELQLFEEIKFEPCVMCEPVDMEASFRTSLIEDGDIICFQKAQIDGEDKFRYPDVPRFLEYVHNCQIGGDFDCHREEGDETIPNEGQDERHGETDHEQQGHEANRRKKTAHAKATSNTSYKRGHSSAEAEANAFGEYSTATAFAQSVEGHSTASAKAEEGNAEMRDIQRKKLAGFSSAKILHSPENSGQVQRSLGIKRKVPLETGAITQPQTSRHSPRKKVLVTAESNPNSISQPNTQPQSLQHRSWKHVGQLPSTGRSARIMEQVNIKRSRGP